MQNYTFRRKSILLTLAAAVVFFATAFFIVSGVNNKKQSAFAATSVTSNIKYSSADFGVEINKNYGIINGYDPGYPFITVTDDNKLKIQMKYSVSDELRAEIKTNINKLLGTITVNGSEPRRVFAADYMLHTVITRYPNDYVTMQKDFNPRSPGAKGGKRLLASKSYSALSMYSDGWWNVENAGYRNDEFYVDFVPDENNDDKLYMFGLLYRASYIISDYSNPTIEIYGVTALTEFTINDVVKENAKKLSSSQMETMKDVAVLTGLCESGDEAASLKVNYYKIKNADEYETVTDTYEIPAYGVWCERALKEQILKKQQYGGDLSYFDAEYETTVDAVLKGTGEAVEGVTDKRVMRRAKGFNYSLDGKVVTLDVDYSDFDYTDFCVHVNNNGSEFPNLKLDIYATDHSFIGGWYKLEWDYGAISERLLTNLGWTTNFVRENEGEEEIVVSVSGGKDTLKIYHDANRLTISVREKDLNDLFGLSVVMVAQLVDDIKIPFSYEYMVLDNDFNEVWRVSEVTNEWYSDILRWKVAGNFERKFYTKSGVIYKGVHPEGLGDVEYCKFNKVKIDVTLDEENRENNVAKAKCYYRYNTLVKTINGYNGYEKYYVLAEMPQFSYKVGDLDFGEIPKGYRISKVMLDGGGDITEDLLNYRNSVITFYRDNEYSAKVITVTATLTDEWAVTVEYLVKYKDTPFAEKKTFEGKIKVLDFEDPELPGVLKKMTAEDLAKVLGIETMNVLKSTVDTIDQQFDEATETYSFVPKYTFSSLKQLDHNGTTSEVKVPLTSYYEWSKDYGKDWSILFLNSSDKQWFTYSNEVAIENLYGYFAVAVFKEQVSDFNHWFKGSTGDGCMVLSEEMKVEGSKFYKISQKVQENSLFVAAAGAVVGGCIGGVQGAVIGTGIGLALPSVVMSACEIADDSNAMYYSYWFYLDGSSDLPFMAKNNAKTAEDTDGAAKNKFDAAMANAGEWVKEKWTEFKASQTYEIVKWVLIVGACLVLVVLFIKLIIAIAKK